MTLRYTWALENYMDNMGTCGKLGDNFANVPFPVRKNLLYIYNHWCQQICYPLTFMAPICCGEINHPQIIFI